MLKFEVGKKYQTRSICDHECIFEIKIIKRTPKMITYEYEGKIRRSKPYEWDGVEQICPERYSMCPIFGANNS